MNTPSQKNNHHRSGVPFARRTFLFAFLVLGLSIVAARADANTPPDSGELYSLGSSPDLTKIKTENASVTLGDKDGAKLIKLLLPANQSYPGINFPCPEGGWNLSGYNGAQVDVTNTGDAKVGVALRVDNPGDWQKSPWNTEIVYIDPSQTKTIHVTFGMSYGNSGFVLDRAHVVNIKVFANKVAADTTLLVGNLKASK